MPPKKESAAAAAAAAAAASSVAPAAGFDPHDDGGAGAAGEGKEVSSFIAKIYKMVGDPLTQDIVCWNERGDGFLVKNEFRFAAEMMNNYFRHQNFSSFVRQLNFYGFHKRSSPSSLTSFYHPSFRKGHPELLSSIIRKSPETKDAGLRDLVTNLSTEVAELRQQNEDLFKIQQRILYIFSRYMRATQAGAAQVGGSQAAGIGGQRDEGGSGTKRIRGRDASDGAKRQRLLMAGRPDSPQHDAAGSYHADNYNSSPSSKSNSDYFPSAAAGGNRGNNSSSAAAGGQQNGPLVSSPSESGGVVDLNTDQYHSSSMYPNANYSATSGNMDPSGYGTHALSDLNWSSDPVSAINDLIGAMPSHAQSVLNTSMSQMPMQMGRAAGSNANQQMMQGPPFMVDNAGFGYGAGGLPLLGAPARRGVSGAAAGPGSNQHLLDLSSQLASSNPKQLLQMLDRMGADQGAMGGADSASRAMGSARKLMQGRGAAGDDGLYSMTDDPSSSSNQAISGVFEDANDLLAAAPTTAAAKATKGKAKRSSTKSSSKAAAAADSAPAATATKASSSRSRRSTPAAAAAAAAAASAAPINIPSPAKLSPIDDLPTSFTLGKDPSAAIPLLNSLPLPTSPISPFGDGPASGSNLAPPQDAYVQQAQMQQSQLQQQQQQQQQQQPASAVGYADLHLSMPSSLLHSPAPPLGHGLSSLALPDLNRDSSLTLGLGSDHSGLMGAGSGGAGGYATGSSMGGGMPPSPYHSAMGVGSGAQQLDNLMPLTPNLSAPLSPSPFR